MITLVGLLMVFILPPFLGLDSHVIRAAGILVIAIIFWATEVVNATVTALLVFVLLPLLGVITYADTFAVLGHTIIWRLLGIFILTAAIQKSGLDRRLAARFLKLAGSKTKRLLLLILLLTFFTVFLVPNSMARAALVGAVSYGILSRYGINSPSSFGRAIFIAIPVVSLVTSSSLIVGASAEMYAAGLFDSVLGYHWTYLSWLKVNLPIGLSLTLLLYPLFIHLHAPEFDEFPSIVSPEAEGSDYTDAGLSGEEWRALICFLGLFITWITDTAEEFPAELIAAILLLLPRIGFITWAEASAMVEWGTLLLMGSGLALAKGLQQAGLVNSISNYLVNWVGSWPPVAVVVAIYLLTMLVRMGLANMTGVLSTLLPLVLNLGQAIGLNPVWLGMSCVVAAGTGFFFPAQSTAALATYGYGYYTSRDMFRTGVWVGLLMIILTLLAAFFYWPLVGLPIYLY